MRPPIARFRDRHGLPPLRGAFLVPRSQTADPIAIDDGLPVACALRDRRQGLGRARKDRDLAAAVVAQFRRRIGNVHETRAPEHRGRTIGELEVEPAADRSHQIGLTHHAAPHRCDYTWVSVWDESATFAGIKTR